MATNQLVSLIDLRSRIAKIARTDPAGAQLLTDIQTGFDLIDQRFRILSNATLGQLPPMSIDGSHLNSLSIGNAQIGNLDAGKITTGTLAAARIAAASIDATKLNIKDIILVNLTFTSNSPIAGSVAWSACTVYWNGAGYVIASGNTANPIVYWDTTNLTFSTTTMAGYTPQTGRFIIATNVSGTASETWNTIGSQVVTTKMLADGAITAIKVTSIDAATITTGTLNAARIAAAAIDATKLNIRQIIVVGLTLTSNSPSAGEVAWSACTVYWNGTAYAISSGNTSTTNVFIYWDSGNSTFTAADAAMPQINRYLIATNTSGTADEAWNKLALSGVQEENLSFGLITGIQIQPVSTSSIGTTSDGASTLINLTGFEGAFLTFGIVVAVLTDGTPTVKIRFQFDGLTPTDITLMAGNVFNSSALALAQNVTGTGGVLGDLMNFQLNVGFASSLLVQIVVSGSAGSTDGAVSVVSLYAAKAA